MRGLRHAAGSQPTADSGGASVAVVAAAAHAEHISRREERHCRLSRRECGGRNGQRSVAARPVVGSMLSCPRMTNTIYTAHTKTLTARCHYSHHAPRPPRYRHAHFLLARLRPSRTAPPPAALAHSPRLRSRRLRSGQVSHLVVHARPCRQPAAALHDCRRRCRAGPRRCSPRRATWRLC